ncbi:MAG: phosphoglucosamine mutase, partial [Gammaproteobacteria bacterium]|nr:phosphoglucosamine mutase [Gammaproteobacteria bacterium]
DRLIMVDNKGEVVDGDELLYVIARSRQAQGSLNGGVVGTLMSNFGMEKALQTQKIPFKRAKVGDRYVMEMLKENDWFLGGESSGHIICLDRTTTGDGLASSLQVVAAMIESGRNLHELKSGMRKYPQSMINVRVAKKPNLNKQAIKDAVSAIETKLGDNGRVLLRPSGTEPLVRVMIEGNDAMEVDQLTKELAEQVEALLKKSG